MPTCNKKIYSCVFLLFISFPLFAQINTDTVASIKNNPGIYSLVISRNDHIICQKYFNGHRADELYNNQSLTKSIVAVLIGIAIDKGYIKSVDEKIVDFFPELKNDADKRKQTITIRQIMNQASGLYHEDLDRLDLYLHLPDPSGYVLKSPLLSEPGKVYHYSNAATHLLSVILTKSTDMDTRAFAAKYLLTPLGITNFEWPKLNDGYYDGAGLLAIRLQTRDMVKIGSLLLHNGLYNSKQVVSTKWITQLLRPDITYPTEWGLDQSTYGLCWYHNVYKGTYITYGLGWGGQFVMVIPSFKTVIAINENPANENAIKQSIAFTTRIFPAIFDQLK
jgi:CubicO group peptidase (beta-lactamase class C family)